VTIHLVRHVKAGVRSKWTGPDALRPVSKVGRRQAQALVKVILDAAGEERITHVVSSPYVRCRQTVEPLADELQLEVELADALAEDTPLADSLRLLEKYIDDNAVFCTHGDVLGNLLGFLATKGLRQPHDRLEKGSTWVLDVADGEVTGMRYLGPPTP
jgi:8-oxo-dGTP diphosphatase